jgi:hypothetical protein
VIGLISSPVIVNSIGKGYYDCSITGICPPAWNKEMNSKVSMSSVGLKRPSGHVQIQQCSFPSQHGWHF